MYSNWRPDPRNAQYIQEAIDSVPAGGGRLRLPNGTYPGFTIPNNKPGIIIEGESRDGVIITGSIWVGCGYTTLERMTVRGTGQLYGVKLYREVGGVSSGGAPRIKMNDMAIGATYEGAGDGPSSHGLWLDGAILLHASNIVSSFNLGSGVFMDTTDAGGLWSTNVNKFENCTFNGNDRWGAEMVGGGIMNPLFHGGNMEGNTIGEVKADSVTGLELRGVDFEGAKVITEVIQLGACNPVLIEGCGFNYAVSSASRAFGISTCVRARVAYNRIFGFPAGQIGYFDENSQFCEAFGNMLEGPDRYINNRGRM